MTAPRPDVPEAAAPALSVVLPVYNGAATLEATLGALRASSFRDYELIVVDDGSSDATAALIERSKPDLFLRNSTNQGPAAARNRGAAAARGRVLFFTDADVCVAPDTLARVAARFGDPALECLVGLYEPEQPHANAASIYKNAWIHHSYMRAPEDINWFFTAVGAVRRDIFHREGGFAPRFRRERGGGDVEFGHRLCAAGVRIRMDKSLRVAHTRRFTLRSLVANDYRRAAGWTGLVLGSPGALRTAAGRGVANVSRSFAASAAVALASCLAMPFALRSRAGLVALGLGLGLYVVLNLGFHSFALARFGWRRCASFVAIGFLDHVACAIGVLVGAGAAWRGGTARVAATEPAPSAMDDGL